MKKLVLITNGFPYGIVNETFLEEEIGYLSKKFDEITIIARTPCKSKEHRSIPLNCKVLHISPTSSIQEWFILLWLGARNFFFISQLVATDLKNCYKRFGISAKRMKFILHTCAKALLLSDQITKIIDADKINEPIYYSYWLDTSSLALSILVNKKNIIAIARAHRGDLYEETSPFGFHPFRQFVLDTLERIYPISVSGKEYLEDNFTFDSNLVVSRLGVNDPQAHIANKQYEENIIVSCSYVSNIKRVDKIIEVLENLKTKSIKWIHFGDGPIYKKLNKLAQKKLINIKYELKGSVENTQIHTFYEQNHISLFVNLSTSEGIPVSIMEAMSHQIPTLATNVGGVSELVDDTNGFLVSPDLDIKMIAKKIDTYLNLDESIQQEYREAAYLKWKLEYRASTNYDKFASQISSIQITSEI